ncbi:MAG: hypothetical protein ACI4US_07505 [Muribaculaceae bacterium]
MKSLLHLHRSNPLACGNFAPPCFLKPIAALLLALLVAVPAVFADAPLHPGLIKLSNSPEDIKIATDITGAKPLKANEVASYTEWESLGMASWHNNTWEFLLKGYMGEIGENHFQVWKRTNTDNPELIQIKLEGVFGGADFIIDGNTGTYECSAARQPTNYDCSGRDGATLSKYEAFITNEISPLFSLPGGKILFSLGFYYTDTRSVSWQVAIVNFDNAPQFGYTIEGRHIYGKDENTATISLNPTGATKQFKYLLSSGYTGSTDIFKKHSDKLQTATTSITVPLETGCRTLHILPCDADGNWLGFIEYDIYILNHPTFDIQSNRGDSYEWIPYGSATIHEGVCKDNNANVEGAPETFVCEALTRKDAPGKFLRIVNPYSPQSPVGSVVLANGNSRYELNDEDFYIDINLEDKDKPYVYNRPVGLELFSEFDTKFGEDGWSPVGTETYSTHTQLLNGTDPAKIEYATYKWNRLYFGQRSLEIELSECSLQLPDKNISEDMSLTLQADNNVEYIKYAFVKDGKGRDIADKIAAGDASLTIYTSPVDKAVSRSAERTVTINVPSDIPDNISRIVAVPYTAQSEIVGTYLDSEINLWYNIGSAEVTGGFESMGLKPSATVQQYLTSMKFRLVKPFANKRASEYIYIDTSDPQSVNISSDGETEDIHTGLYFAGHSKYNYILFNTAHNYVTTGVLNLSQYNVPVLNGRTITAPEESMVYTEVIPEDTEMRFYWLPEGTITLPEWKKAAGVGSVTIDKADTDTPVEYYNLQGVKIAEPGPGLYIRRQGSKAQKILIR